VRPAGKTLLDLPPVETPLRLPEGES
jgi:hypothetical protein